LARTAAINSENALKTSNAKSNFAGTGTIHQTASRALTIDADKLKHRDKLTIDGVTVEFYDSSKGPPVSGLNLNIFDEKTGERKTDNQIAKELTKLDFGDQVEVSYFANQLIVKAALAGRD